MLAAFALRAPLTATMFLHMLVHIPLILLSGILAGRAWSMAGIAPRLRALLGSFDPYGLAGLLFFSLVVTYWMIPKALDEVLLFHAADLSKFASVFIAGLVLYFSLRRANIVVQLFFLGNMCWMMAIVGLLYRENPTRLCNFYLMNDQEIAGTGLVAVAIALPVIWLWAWRRRIWRFLR
ncbi:hypothetical protein ERD78_02535 [Allopusillimonas soli]|uniref:Uncharacterized protein n=1 Tax=Allopusillimonas soli TaxID=659016 RepID=A0A853F5E7_9BURK|nr:hypothetical protein [Allopusillimonas soli]TEA76741.1 hypothetical protein ERD78_02535 [Allopusillimonas soli]